MGTSGDASSGDASDAAVSETRITGTLDGEPFVMLNAAVEWGSIDALCGSTSAIVLDDCLSGTETRIALYGWFLVTDNGAEWGFPQVELRRLDSGADTVELASDGWMTVYKYEPELGHLDAEFELVFASGVATGTVVVR
jgi:hypothetical protein